MNVLVKSTAIALLLVSSPVISTTAMAQQNCPPGLAKKNPPCVPPGQARQGVTTEEWLNRHTIGDQIDDDDYLYLDRYNYDRWSRLPRLGSDEAYVVYDNGIVVMNRTSLRILRLVDLLTN